jgi:hypothetical protein
VPVLVLTWAVKVWLSPTSLVSLGVIEMLASTMAVETVRPMTTWVSMTGLS